MINQRLTITATDKATPAFRSLAENMQWLIDNADAHNLDMDKVIKDAEAAEIANAKLDKYLTSSEIYV